MCGVGSTGAVAPGASYANSSVAGASGGGGPLATTSTGFEEALKGLLVAVTALAAAVQALAAVLALRSGAATQTAAGSAAPSQAQTGVNTIGTNAVPVASSTPSSTSFVDSPSYSASPPPAAVAGAPGVGPSASLNPTDGVVIQPGQDIQAAIDANPPGTTFVISAGTYHLGSPLHPKQGQRFIGQLGAVLEGGDSTERAFVGGGGADNVTISNLVIRNFRVPTQGGAIDSKGSSGWIVTHNDVGFNHNGGGIRTNDNSQVIGNFIHDNGQIGITGGGSNILVEGNEIAHNNIDGFDPGWEAGGSKWANTNNLVVRGNYVHDNIGPGLWTDINNQNTLYENNVVENNRGAGIFHEISYAAVIRNNTVRGNGRPDAPWLWEAGIQIAASENVEVYGNILEGNAHGVAVIQQDRTKSSGEYSAPIFGDGNHYYVRNVNVHDNVMSNTGQSGFVEDIGDRSILDTRNVVFTNNQGQGELVWG